MNRVGALAMRIAAVIVLAFAAAAAAVAGDRMAVKASILPIATFVERVGGGWVDVQVLVGPGQSPHTYAPTPRQVEKLSESKAFFRVGVDFEKAFVERVASNYPNVRIVDLRAGIAMRSMSSGEATSHAHHGDADHECRHEAGEPDPHTWLSPRNARIQAATIARVLSEIDPQRAEEFNRNLEKFTAELDAVHAEIAAALAPLKGREVFVYHPAFGYFLDEYGLKQSPVEIEGKEPSARQLAELIDRAKAANVKVIFVQPQFSVRSAQAIADAIDGAVVPMDDLAPDYVANLREMARKIQEKFREPK